MSVIKGDGRELALYVLDRSGEGNGPSGVWNIPELPKSSLVGLAPPARGDAGGLTRLIGAGRLEGPIEARALLFTEPFILPVGAGEGLGLVDGGRKDISGRVCGSGGCFCCSGCGDAQRDEQKGRE